MWESNMPDIDFADNSFGIIKINGVEMTYEDSANSVNENEERSSNSNRSNE